MNPQFNVQIKNIQHDIFMYEVSICLDVESKKEPSRGFMAPSFIRAGWDGGVKGESVSFNRHLGFEAF